MRLKTNLEQWITLFEIDKAGSIQAAAIQLNKSHTTLIYTIRKLETQLGMPVLKTQGRRSVLTDEGKSLLRRAQSMIEQAKLLEDIGSQLGQGIESELVIAIDHLCDREWLYGPLALFLAQNNTTSVQIVETSLSKTTSMVTDEKADISIITLPITNHPCEAFGIVKMLPVVAKNHLLAAKSEPCLADLTSSRQIVIRDLGSSEKRDVGWLKSNQRVTVDNFDHAWQAIKQGLGYCRLPQHIIEQHNDDDVVILEVEHSSSYQVPLHLSLPKGAKSGPSAKYFYQLLLQSAGDR
jgi:DNA-binding transcriptional LysR family regulator